MTIGTAIMCWDWYSWNHSECGGINHSVVGLPTYNDVSTSQFSSEQISSKLTDPSFVAFSCFCNYKEKASTSFSCILIVRSFDAKECWSEIQIRRQLISSTISFDGSASWDSKLGFLTAASVFFQSEIFAVSLSRFRRKSTAATSCEPKEKFRSR